MQQTNILILRYKNAWDVKNTSGEQAKTNMV